MIDTTEKTQLPVGAGPSRTWLAPTTATTATSATCKAQVREDQRPMERASGPAHTKTAAAAVMHRCVTSSECPSPRNAKRQHKSATATRSHGA